jgi:hypothetical protein
MFNFRIRNVEFSSWTPFDTEKFRLAVQNLLKSSTVRVVNVREGSVVIDTSVSASSTPELAAVTTPHISTVFQYCSDVVNR